MLHLDLLGQLTEPLLLRMISIIPHLAQDPGNLPGIHMWVIGCYRGLPMATKEDESIGWSRGVF